MSHTLVATAVYEELQGEGKDQIRVKSGGKLYVAGPANVLGTYCPVFTRITSLDDATVCHLSAGFCHSSVITSDGELYSWGMNRAGCCGQPVATRFLDQVRTEGRREEVAATLPALVRLAGYYYAH